MKTGKWIVMSAAVLMTGSMLVAANQSEAPATQPTAKTARHVKGRLTKPWSEITGLTDAQKEEIEQIHANAMEQEKQIRAAEHTQAEAVLTDEQKAQLKVLEEKPNKPRASHKKSAESPTTAPAKD